MNFEASTLIQLATLISVVAGVIGLMISVRAYKRQVSALFLLEYTRRVDDIMRSLPRSVWAADLFPNEELPEPSDELRLRPRDIWRKGQGVYAEILRSPLFMREWKTVAPMAAADQV